MSKMLWRILLPVLGLLVLNGDASDTPTQIFNRLMQNYSRDETPGFPDKPTEVKLGIYVNSLNFIGDKTEDISLTFYLRQSWTDPRLSFSSTIYGKRKDIRPPENSWNQIWLPDTFIRNSKSVKITDDLSANRLLKLNASGSVWYVSKVTAVVPCRFKMHRYPFDEQRIHLLFESFGHQMSSLKLSALERPVEVASDLMISQFRLTDIPFSDCSMNYTTGSYTCLDLTFVLKRDSCRFVLQFYLPSIIFVVLSWLAFWIDPETSSASRILTSILPLVALVLLNALSSHSAYVVNYLTQFDVWMLVSYVFVFATLVEYAVVSVLSKKPSGARGLEYLKPPFAGTEKAIEASEKPGERSSSDGKRKARLVDWFSRICFPIAYIIFNLIYWIANSG